MHAIVAADWLCNLNSTSVGLAPDFLEVVHYEFSLAWSRIATSFHCFGNALFQCSISKVEPTKFQWLCQKIYSNTTFLLERSIQIKFNIVMRQRHALIDELVILSAIIYLI